MNDPYVLEEMYNMMDVLHNVCPKDLMSIVDGDLWIYLRPVPPE